MRTIGLVLPGGSDSPKELGKMKVDELKAYAEVHGIDLDPALNKAGIVKAIEDAESAEPETAAVAPAPTEGKGEE